MLSSSTRSTCLRRFAPVLAISVLVGFSGCSTTMPELPPTPPPVPAVAMPIAPPPPPAPRPKVEVASWYGPGFNGRMTSTGERYNQNALTAASKTLPIGSRVVVKNPANGKSVTVRINDRGPHVRGRTMDLSKRAAEKLGITKNGVARVEVMPAAHKTPLVEVSTPASRPPPNPQHHCSLPRRSGRLRAGSRDHLRLPVQ